MSECRSCLAPIEWAITSHLHRRIPVDLEPVPEGNVRVDEGVATVLAGAELEQARAAGEPLRLAHFATCPNAAEWRRA